VNNIAKKIAKGVSNKKTSGGNKLEKNCYTTKKEKVV